jgi:hypothetical protein
MYHLLLSFKKKKHHMCWDVAQGQHCKAMSLNPGNIKKKDTHKINPSYFLQSFQDFFTKKLVSYFFFGSTGELRASRLLGRHPIPSAKSPGIFTLVIFEIVSCVMLSLAWTQHIYCSLCSWDDSSTPLCPATGSDGDTHELFAWLALN